MLRGSPTKIATLRVEDIPFQILCSNAERQGIVISKQARIVLENMHRRNREIFPSTSVEAYSVMAERDLNAVARNCIPRSIRATYRNAINAGLCMCPDLFALYFLLDTSLLRGLAGDHSVIAHNPVPCACEHSKSGERNYVLTIHDRNEPNSRGGIGVFHADWNAHLGDGIRLIFCKQTPDLIAMGLNKLARRK